MSTTHQCINCPRETTDVYLAPRNAGYLCRDCHETSINKRTMERVYADDEAQRAMEPSGVRVIRKKL